MQPHEILVRNFPALECSSPSQPTDTTCSEADKDKCTRSGDDSVPIAIDDPVVDKGLAAATGISLNMDPYAKGTRCELVNYIVENTPGLQVKYDPQGFARVAELSKGGQ